MGSGNKRFANRTILIKPGLSFRGYEFPFIFPHEHEKFPLHFSYMKIATIFMKIILNEVFFNTPCH